MLHHFHNLFVFGRPAAGKSEFIDFMKHCDPLKRLQKMHVADLDIIDDFFLYVELTEQEDIFEKFGIKRSLTKRTPDGVVVVDRRCFDFSMEKFNRILAKKTKNDPQYYQAHTQMIEFSRGIKEDSYKNSLVLLENSVLSPGAIIYIKASYSESVRRNNARYQAQLKHSSLAHKCPDEAMERFYRDDDWNDLTKGESHGHIEINGVKIPFVTMDNEIESKDPVVLEGRYQTALQTLFEIWEKK